MTMYIKNSAGMDIEFVTQRVERGGIEPQTAG